MPPGRTQVADRKLERGLSAPWSRSVKVLVADEEELVKNADSPAQSTAAQAVRSRRCSAGPAVFGSVRSEFLATKPGFRAEPGFVRPIMRADLWSTAVAT